jgi:hypothetical protein
VAERRVLDAIALAAWEQGHRFLLPWRILAAVLLGGGFPADLHGGASARFILAVTLVAVCNGIEASRHGAEPSTVDSPWRALAWPLARIYTIR